MVAAVAPFVDSAISKTVNVPEDYPYEHFKNLYLEAWQAGLKGITTYRPNKVLAACCRESDAGSRAAQRFDTSETDRRPCASKPRRNPALSSLRWPSRPKLPGATARGRKWSSRRSARSRSSSATSRTARPVRSKCRG